MGRMAIDAGQTGGGVKSARRTELAFGWLCPLLALQVFQTSPKRVTRACACPMGFILQCVLRWTSSSQWMQLSVVHSRKIKQRLRVRASILESEGKPSILEVVVDHGV